MSHGQKHCVSGNENENDNVMPPSVAILQARTSSRRLPAKSLLPLAGYPIAILSALRAANRSRTVVLATSDEASDDALARLAKEHKIACFRGSLANTLHRVVSAAQGYGPDTLVFRLTADNVFPDGHLLNLMEQHFIEAGLEYLRSTGPESGLPYGVSVELTRLRHLRHALANAETSDDLEHVTPFIRRKHDSIFREFEALDLGHLRATIDTLDDYLAIEQLFADEPAPLEISFLDLTERLASANKKVSSTLSHGRLVLGTAQLGLEYGVANQDGMPDKQESEKIVRLAVDSGVEFLDTAHAYGKSESIVGAALKVVESDSVRVVTKLSPLDEWGDDADKRAIESCVDASVFQSCRNLGLATLDFLLMHRACHIHKWGGVVLDRLAKLQGEGVIHALGVSVQTPEELRLALECEAIQLIQLPLNVLDWRFDSLMADIDEHRKNRGLVIHTRSCFLQGLLVKHDIGLWRSVGIDEPSKVFDWLEEEAARYGQDALSFCLNYCLGQSWVDGVVVGVEGLAQLQEILSIEPLELSHDELDRVRQSRPKLRPSQLNPAMWHKVG